MVNMKIKVLIIDDDPAITELLTLVLSTNNFEVISSNYGEVGIQKVQEDKPDVIILDLMMPAMDGWKVCTAIRKISNIPILILSALDNPGVVVSALDAGADDFLTKPVSSGVLVSRIRTLTRRNSASESGEIIHDTTSSKKEEITPVRR